jgi:hypothetical protein
MVVYYLNVKFMDEITIYDDVMWTKGKDIVPTAFYQVYRIKGGWIQDDESLYYTFEPGDGFEPSEISIVDLEDPSITYTKIEANKYGTPDYMETIKVKITPSATLAEAYPGALVVIDGKTYDLGKLSSYLEFIMSSDHRVTIEWATGLHESFRIVKR